MGFEIVKMSGLWVFFEKRIFKLGVSNAFLSNLSLFEFFLSDFGLQILDRDNFLMASTNLLRLLSGFQ